MVAAAGILLMNWRRKLDDEEDSEVKEGRTIGSSPRIYYLTN